MLTEEELKFLRDLQKRLREGDHVSTAFPRYWGLKDFEWVPCVDTEYSSSNDTGNTKQVIWSNDDLAEYDAEEFIEYVKDDILGIDPLSDREEAQVEELLELLVDLDGFIDFEVFDSIKTIVGYSLTSFDVVTLKEVIVNIENVLFLSLEEAQEHIKKNYYHYTERVYPYGYHSWRSTDYEKLMRIVFEGDFN